MKLMFASLLLGVVLKEGATYEKCKEDELKKCVLTMEHLLINQIEGIKKGQKDLSDYCQALEREGECLKQASKTCKEKHPQLSVLASTFYAYLNQFCNEKAKLYMEVAPCFETHKFEFEKCFPDHKGTDDPLKAVCTEMPSMRCLAELSKKKCKDGEAFGNALLAHVKDLEKGVCNSAAAVFAFNFAILLSTVLSLHFIKTKI